MAGSRNNSDGDKQASSGAAGGGMIIIRAGNLAGTATISANGAAAYNATAQRRGRRWRSGRHHHSSLSLWWRGRAHDPSARGQGRKCMAGAGI